MAFQIDRNKHKNGIVDIYNPDGNSFEKENEEKISRFEKAKGTFSQYASLFRSYPWLIYWYDYSKGFNIQIILLSKIVFESGNEA